MESFFFVISQPFDIPFKFQMYSAQEMKNKFNMMANLVGEADEDDDDQVSKNSNH